MELEVELLREMVVALPDPVFVLTENGRYAAIAGGRDSTWYHDGSHLAGLFLHDVMPAGKADWFLSEIRQTLAENRLRTVEYTLSGDEVEGLDMEAGPDGVIFFEGRIQPLPVPWKGERSVVWVARNITTRHELEGQLRRMSETDPLTGVYNRRKLVEQLQERFAEFRRYARPATLIMFDIDHFKRINDRFGHGAGDDVLCCIADICLEQLRDVDLFCRVGGEEFAALLPETDLDAATRVADRLREAVARHSVQCAQGDVSVTVSLGVAGFVATDALPEDVLRRADDALYQAKRAGRDRVIPAG